MRTSAVISTRSLLDALPILVFGSGTALETPAVLTRSATVPAFTVTTTVSDADAPGARYATTHHVFTQLSETRRTPSGTASVITTLVAVDGPSFVMTSV